MATALVLAPVIGAAPAFAAPSRSLAVSVPSEPTKVSKGAEIEIPIRVINPGSEPVSVSITPRAVLLGDDGQVNIGVDVDPDWQDRVQFEPATATIGASQYIDVAVTVDVPATITSDLHFVGFLVSPVASAQGQVTVINQIGSFVTLDVPGPRTALLQATLRIPGFTIGRHATGHVQVANIGPSSVRFWGESNTTSWPAGSTPTQQRFEKALSPDGATRTLTVSAKPAWLIGFVTIHGQIIYAPTTESATTEITFNQRVFVIDPRLIAAIAGLLVLVSLGWYLRHRHRRSPMPTSKVSPPAEPIFHAPWAPPSPIPHPTNSAT